MLGSCTLYVQPNSQGALNYGLKKKKYMSIIDSIKKCIILLYLIRGQF